MLPLAKNIRQIENIIVLEKQNYSTSDSLLNGFYLVLIIV